MFEDNTHFKMDILGLDVSLFENEYKTQEQDFDLLVINIELISLCIIQTIFSGKKMKISS